MNMKLCPRDDDWFENGTGDLFDVINGKIGDGLSAKEAMLVFDRLLNYFLIIFQYESF